LILDFPATSHQPLPWYALQVKCQHEFHVERELRRHHIESYLPTRQRKGWRNSVVEVPLLPGYVFARCLQEQLYGTLRFTGWLQWIVGNQNGPIEIPVEQIETLRLMIARPEVVVMNLEDVWHGGEQVEITEGPLKGSIGRVAMVKGKAHLIVSIEMLGRAVSTELDAAAVRALPDLPKAA
jgi:transcription antitermination factor NusG